MLRTGLLQLDIPGRWALGIDRAHLSIVLTCGPPLPMYGTPGCCYGFGFMAGLGARGGFDR